MRVNYICALFFIFGHNAFAASACTDINQDLLQECLLNEYDLAENGLHKVYSELMENISTSKSLELQKSQEEWMKRQEQNCEFLSSSHEGGQAYIPLYLSCLIENTKIRIQELDGAKSSLLE